jgi:hypothetical protein
MRNEIGENRVLFCVWGERREDNRPRETTDYRVPFGMCVNLKLREYHTCENEMGIEGEPHPLEFAPMESFFFFLINHLWSPFVNFGYFFF